MRKCILFCVLFFSCITIARSQYEFKGHVNDIYKDGTIYLSVIEDYRKISGVHPEQILNTTKADTTGFFVFTGDNLSTGNKMYRIHVDKCSEEEQQVNHFMGHCANSKEIVFIANNATKLDLPFTFEDEMFCSIVSKNQPTNAFLKIDSLKNDMKYAFATYRSEANRKLNSKKWFGILQTYGEQLGEPLAELYSYSFLSERGSDLHSYYLDDFSANNYYSGLLHRLQKKYPNSPYTQQYEAEIEADKVLLGVGSDANNDSKFWLRIVIALLLISLLINVILIRNRKKTNSITTKREQLSKQEEKVLQLILENKTNKEIAAEIFVSVSTVKTHINNLYKKLEVTSREEVKNLQL